MQFTQRVRTAKTEFRVPERSTVLLVGAVLAFSGCRLFEKPDSPLKTDSVLRPANASPNSVTIEVLLVLVPDLRLAQLDEVWLHADEQVVDANARRELARNGFRAGVIGPAPPPGLAELLQLDAGDVVRDDVWQTVPLDKRPTITGHRLSMPPHKRFEIQLEPIHDVAPLFVATDAGLAGNDYLLAQGKYAVEWMPLSQNRIQIEVTPELHHGRPRTQYALAEGNDIHRQLAQEIEVFEALRIRAPLIAGQMLLISGDQKGSGSLGHFFHSMPSPEGGQHRLVVVRLAQVPAER